MKFKIIYTVLTLLVIVIFSCESSVTEKKLTEEEKIAYLILGQEITNKAFATLAGELTAALKEGGIANAMNYCKVYAIPLVDSLAKLHNVDIRRAAMKVRNLLNKATETEELILQTYETQLKDQQPLKPIIHQAKGKRLSYYSPIMVQPFCLQCHGEVGATLEKEDYALIKEKYPTDAAIGFKDGDLRGMWRITFKQ